MRNIFPQPLKVGAGHPGSRMQKKESMRSIYRTLTLTNSIREEEPNVGQSSMN